MAGMTFTFGSGVNDSVFGKSQAPIRMFLEKQGELLEQSSPLGKLFNIMSSKTWGEKLTSMTAFEGFQPVGENGAYPEDTTQEGFSKYIENMTWKDSFAVSREAVDDGKLIDFKQKPQGFVTGYHRAREEYGAALYAGAINGESDVTFRGKTWKVTCADDKKLFATDHPSKLGKTKQSNVFSDAFSVDALGAAESRMQLFQGDAGNLLDVSPTTILIPNDYEAKKVVFAAIGADKDPATANNAFNYQFGRWNVICWSYLNKFLKSYTNFPWILLDEGYNETYGGAVWLERNELEVHSEIASNDANVWKGYARFSAGFNDWRFACCGGISGGTQLIPTSVGGGD